ncbi:hypothetical protein MIND_00783100 [Mycena indigotica]|uniref:Uncharacterized protein n=1 Tax=Mycena indigotica TaxID=2126181 RepID=A0A8H6W235_9AGAR|nr:uncharacterized protein MIND_00783100 [Mycena indigotica]KAF7302162.1 hypothetical protein MIND_00783100 [Mycena indigotica]
MEQHLSKTLKPARNPYLPKLTPLVRPPPPPGWKNARSDVSLAHPRGETSSIHRANASTLAEPILVPNPLHTTDANLTALEGDDLLRAAEDIATVANPPLRDFNSNLFTSNVAHTVSTSPTCEEDAFVSSRPLVLCSDGVKRSPAQVVELWHHHLDVLQVPRPPASFLKLNANDSEVLSGYPSVQQDPATSHDEPGVWHILFPTNAFISLLSKQDNKPLTSKEPTTPQSGDQFRDALTASFPPTPGQEDVSKIYSDFQAQVRRESAIEGEDLALASDGEGSGVSSISDSQASGVDSNGGEVVDAPETVLEDLTNAPVDGDNKDGHRLIKSKKIIKTVNHCLS